MRDKKICIDFYIKKCEIFFLNLLFFYFSDDESKEIVYIVNKDF